MMGNSLVEAKKAGEKNLEVLLAGEMSDHEQSRLREIEIEIAGIDTKAMDGLVQVKLMEASLLEEAFNLLSGDSMTFTAWINAENSQIPFDHTMAFKLRHLGGFCKNKSITNLNVSCLFELSKQKWILDKPNGVIVKDKKKAVTSAYNRLNLLVPKSQTISKTKKVIEEELLKADLSLPPTPPVRKLTVIQMESKLERLLNDVRMGFSGEDRESLKRFIIAEMGGW